MAGYGIAGADAAMGRILEHAGWERQCDGFYLLESGGLGALVRTVHLLGGCPIPAGCRLFQVGETIDLSEVFETAAEHTDAVAKPRRAPQMSSTNEAISGTPSFAGATTHEQPLLHPDDPLSAMLASGLLDDDEGLPSSGSGFADEAGFSGETDSRQSVEADALADDDYSDEMLRIFGLR